jgi:hypothetical protein
MAGTAGLRQREARLEQQASGFMNLEQASTEAKDTLLRVCSRLARVPALSGEEGNVSVTVSDHEDLGPLVLAERGVCWGVAWSRLTASGHTGGGADVGHGGGRHQSVRAVR